MEAGNAIVMIEPAEEKYVPCWSWRRRQRWDKNVLWLNKQHQH
ncbi:hypothetical protein DOY81_000742 [Sarcophaga bullata]|nr:hypothetical protein DOY81_000742 [Sarcophaga bullata]